MKNKYIIIDLSKERKTKEMEFEYRDSFYVSKADLEEMINIARKSGNIWDAMSAVASGWDDVDFYGFGNIEEQVYEYIKEILDNEK